MAPHHDDDLSHYYLGRLGRLWDYLAICNVTEIGIGSRLFALWHSRRAREVGCTTASRRGSQFADAMADRLAVLGGRVTA